ncbi:MAG: hypothetical protein IV090_16150 [Candidatus Sericytochromatia bacterium]|nr:hypothetical protein [Candidatus Sericytochromatia bacterium]
MHFQVSGSGAAHPLEKNTQLAVAKKNPTEKLSATKPEQAAPPQDHLNTQKMSEGKGLSQFPLVDAESPALAARLQKINDLLAKSTKPSLTLAQKEDVLRLLKDSKKDGSLPALSQKLHESKQLCPLYQKMGSLVNRSPESSALLGLVTLGLSLGEEAKSNRAFEMKKILTDAGVAPEILKTLQD